MQTESPIQRHATRAITLGPYTLGSGQPIRVQSMTNTDTRDVAATVSQVSALVDAGCEIVRIAVPDDAAAAVLPRIVAKSPAPLVADIHFDYRLALAAVDAGFAGLRINPGNIGGEAKVNEVVRAAKVAGVPIRIGVNGGSLEKDLLAKHGGPTPAAMVESALGHVALLEARGFDQIKISLKSSSVPATVQAYTMLAQSCDYPLHVGITEAGTLLRGAVKSAVGLGILFWQGLGDTLRVSLTHDPVAEVGVAWQILASLGIRSRGPQVISCPTCGRTEIGLIALAEEVEKRLATIDEEFTVAVMGCVVNGPGEAREADIGIAGGRDCGIIFKKGELVRKVHGDENLLDAFMEEVEAHAASHRNT